MKILNLYAGLGGNRFLWKNVRVVAVEINPNIARAYQELFPEDEVIIADAHEFLLEHYSDSEFDFIWSSPPCTTHSRARFWASKGGRYRPVYPDMSLWQEIIFLRHFRKKLWVVENTVSYYNPLITPTVRIGRHYFWANFYIASIETNKEHIETSRIKDILRAKGLPVELYLKVIKKIKGIRRDKLVRDMVSPRIGLHILEQAKAYCEF